MQLAPLLAAAVAVLTARRSVLGLRLLDEPPDAKRSAQEEAWRQTLHNFKDVQYSGDLTIGGQTIRGILDTGSFELVVFDRSCESCLKAGAYSPAASRSFRAGDTWQTLTYGSGLLQVEQGFDLVAIGPYSEVEMVFWDATAARMPVLQYAHFNAIVGIGPPRDPDVDALARRSLDSGAEFQTADSGKAVAGHAGWAADADAEPTLIQAFGVTQFSICLGREPGSEGYFVWDDSSSTEHPDQFSRIEVVGVRTWTVRMTGVQLSLGGEGLGSISSCEEGCGALVDSGTSLLMMPLAAARGLALLLESTGANCNNFASLPDLAFTLDGKEFSLPPDAYVAKVEAASASGGAPVPALHRLGFGSGDCELAVMVSTAATSWGPMWILGMPFFREYYTSFRLGRSSSERAIFTSPAASDCRPSAPAALGRRSKGGAYRRGELRSLNRSDIFVSRTMQRAMSEAWFDA